MLIGIDARFYRSSTAGIGRYTRALIDNLSKIDHENDYKIFITPEDDKEFNVKANNFSKVVVPISHYTLAEQTKFLKILNSYKLDLVHFTNFNHPLFYRGKFIVTIHDLTLMLYPQSKNKYSILKQTAFNYTIKNAVKRAEFVLSDSDATKNDIINNLKIDAGKIKTIYLGIDSEYNNKIKENYPLIEKKYKIKKPYILFLSQWRPHKGILELIKTYDLLKEKYKLPHYLVITGKPNPDFPYIIEAIKSSDNSKTIIITNFVDEKDLPLLYKSADLFAFPSHYEGFGIPPLEAMSVGVPVASSNLSCMPEILGEAAYYFNPDKINDIASKIYEVLKNHQLRKNLVQKGFEQIKKYSWAKTAAETLEIYNKALNN